MKHKLKKNSGTYMNKNFELNRYYKLIPDNVSAETGC